MCPGATRRTEPIRGRLQSAETRKRGQRLGSPEGGSGGIRGPACWALCASRGWRVHQAKGREKSSAIRHAGEWRRSLEAAFPSRREGHRLIPRGSVSEPRAEGHRGWGGTGESCGDVRVRDEPPRSVQRGADTAPYQEGLGLVWSTPGTVLSTPLASAQHMCPDSVPEAGLSADSECFSALRTRACVRWGSC